ncbi:MAG: hypothetical protein ACE5D6_08825 [Candidatus Zixiibacteriota bacterium]
MKRSIGIIGVVTLLLALLLSLPANAGTFSKVKREASPASTVIEPVPELTGFDRAAYTGKVRIYIVEPTSRWQDSWGNDYEHALLDFALVVDVNIGDLSSWYQTVTWDGTAAGFGDITESNIMAIAVAFNSTSYVEDAYPPYGYWFNAYYVDAAAEATPGVPGQNETATGFTHSVFLEEGTATW